MVHDALLGLAGTSMVEVAYAREILWGWTGGKVRRTALASMRKPEGEMTVGSLRQSRGEEPARGKELGPCDPNKLQFLYDKQCAGSGVSWW